MVLLRPLGEMESMGRRRPGHRCGIAKRSNPPAEEPSFCIQLDERERQPASSRCRADVCRDPETTQLAESFRIFRNGATDKCDRRERGEDDRSLRVRPTFLLAC